MLEKGTPENLQYCLQTSMCITIQAKSGYWKRFSFMEQCIMCHKNQSLILLAVLKFFLDNCSQTHCHYQINLPEFGEKQSEGNSVMLENKISAKNPLKSY